MELSFPTVPVIAAVLVLFTAVVTLIRSDDRWKTYEPLKYLLIILFILTFITSTYSAYEASYIKRPFWVQIHFEGYENGVPALKLGTAILSPTSNFTGPLFDIAGDTIRVGTYNNKMMLQVIVRDKQGEQIAAMSNNILLINPNINADYNYDERAFEIMDETGDVILQAQFDSDGILFAGKFYTTDGLRIGLGNNIIEWKPADEPLSLKIEPLFKYPGASNTGIRR
jgi:hypothetical protein